MAKCHKSGMGEIEKVGNLEISISEIICDILILRNIILGLYKISPFEVGKVAMDEMI
jgi:hypothetical protein